MTSTQEQNESIVKIVEVKKQEWDAFVDASPQATVFNQSFFLESYRLPVKYLLSCKGQEKLAGFAGIETTAGFVMNPYCVYNGILFRDFSDQKEYRRNENRFLAMEALADHLCRHYGQVDFVNHWSVTDFRPFEWLNYHEREKGSFKVSLSYTSHLDISGDTSGYARARVRDLNKKEDGASYQTQESQDIDVLVRLHDLTFSRQGIARSPYAKNSLEGVCAATLGAGAAKLYVTSRNQEAVAASLFVYDANRAYHLVLGADDRYVEEGIGTKHFHDCCHLLKTDLKIHQLDLVGINNPQRARYKLSYGGTVVPYMRVTKVLSS